MNKFDALVRLAAGTAEPTSEQISSYMKMDKSRNPFNDSHKPRLRDTIEIIADYKLASAIMLLNKIEAECK